MHVPGVGLNKPRYFTHQTVKKWRDELEAARSEGVRQSELVGRLEEELSHAVGALQSATDENGELQEEVRSLKENAGTAKALQNTIAELEQKIETEREQVL